MLTYACKVNDSSMHAFHACNAEALNWLPAGTIMHDVHSGFHLIDTPFALLKDKNKELYVPFNTMYDIFAEALHILYKHKTVGYVVNDVDYTVLVQLIEYTIQECQQIVIDTVDMQLKLFAYYTHNIILEDKTQQGNKEVFGANVIRVLHMLQYTISMSILKKRIIATRRQCTICTTTSSYYVVGSLFGRK